LRGRGRAYSLLQAANLALFAGGVFLTVAVSVQLTQRLAEYESRGISADGDVSRGPGIVIVAGLMVALLSAGAFLLLMSGRRWACWIDVIIWLLAWFPVAINLNTHVKGFGYQLAAAICLLGIVLAIATYLLMTPEDGQGKGGHASAPLPGS
jgi:uncharacterized membrane protein YqaE (UPF0057 family)